MSQFDLFPVRTFSKVSLEHPDLREKDLGLYLIIERDHNYYDESDTNFLYFNPNTNQLAFGQWTTRGYCGDFHYDYPSIQDASDEIKERCATAIRAYLKGEATPSSFTEPWWVKLNVEEYGIPCVVLGGRKGQKYQGTGHVIKAYEHRKTYGTSYSVSIWTGENMVFANPRFVKIDQIMLLDAIYAYIDGLNFNDLYDILKVVWDSRYDNILDVAIFKVCPLQKVNRPIVTLEMKRASLREWVRERFSDVDDDEQERITHNIMMKKHGEDTDWYYENYE